MKESYRTLSKDISVGYDIVFVARAGISEHKESEVESSMRHALKGCGLI
jgi:ribonuclease P protein component